MRKGSKIRMDRIDKILSHEGFGSRKDVRKLLHRSEVIVNGRRIFDPSFQIDTSTAQIVIDGAALNLHDEFYIMMNKIMHTVCSTKEGSHQTVFDLLDDSYRTPYLKSRLHMIGRLDMDTEGLLLFTTDGALTHRIISPKNCVDKTYFCVLEHDEGAEHRKEIERLFADGIAVDADDNDPAFVCESAAIRWPDEAEISRYTENSSFGSECADFPASQGNTAILTIHEGKYHQVKRMFAAVGNRVVFLKRVSIGGLNLDLTLRPGEYRHLLPNEISALQQCLKTTTF